jgi:hypothetical protein
MSKIFINSSTKFVPQMDMNIRYTDNGGIEATQSFLARKADIGVGNNLNDFRRGTTWETIFPEVPTLYRFLTLKTFDPKDIQPGIVAIECTFTGVQFTGSSSSGDEETIPTTSLRGNLEESPFSKLAKWDGLSAESKKRLGLFMTTGLVTFDIVTGKYGKIDELDGEFLPFSGDPWNGIAATGDELEFAKIIADGEMTYKKGSWTYSYRIEGKTGFTAAQLNSLGKIVANPPGTPAKPATGWTWFLAGPTQEQSGPDRFVKILDFLLIEDNEKNQFLYGS